MCMCTRTSVCVIDVIISKNLSNKSDLFRYFYEIHLFSNSIIFNTFLPFFVFPTVWNILIFLLVKIGSKFLFSISIQINWHEGCKWILFFSFCSLKFQQKPCIIDKLTFFQSALWLYFYIDDSFWSICFTIRSENIHCRKSSLVKIQ